MPNEHHRPDDKRPEAAPRPERPTAPKAPVDISEESIAGEEDPGASLDMDVGGPAPSPTPGNSPAPGKKQP